MSIPKNEKLPVRNETSIKTELAEKTGIPETELTPEMIARYEKLKTVNANLDLLEVHTTQNIAEKITKLNTLFEQYEKKEGVQVASVGSISGVLENPKEAITGALDDAIEGAKASAVDTVAENAASVISKPIAPIVASLAAIPIIGDYFKEIDISGGIGSYIKNFISESWIGKFFMGFFDNFSNKVKSGVSAVIPNSGAKAAELSRENQRNKGIVKENSGSRTQETPEEKLKEENTKYELGITAISKLAPKEVRHDSIFDIMLRSRDIKIAEIKSFSHPINAKGFLEHIGADISHDKAATWFLKNLTDKNSALYGILIGGYEKDHATENIDQKYVKDILLNVYNDRSILQTFSEIDITNLQDSLEENIDGMFHFDPKTQELSGDIVTKATDLGLSGALLKRLLVQSNGKKFTNGKSITELSTEGLSEKDISTLEKIGTFGVNFIEQIQTDKRLNFGNRDAIDKAIAGGNITIENIMKAYILTGGKWNIDEMNGAEKIGSYTAMLGIITSNNDAAGAFTGGIISVTTMWDFYQKGEDAMTDFIPKDVQNFFTNTISIEAVVEKVTEELGSVYGFVKEFAKKSPGFATFLVLCVLFLPLFSRRTSLAGILTGRK